MPGVDGLWALDCGFRPHLSGQVRGRLAVKIPMSNSRYRQQITREVAGIRGDSQKSGL